MSESATKGWRWEKRLQHNDLREINAVINPAENVNYVKLEEVKEQEIHSVLSMLSFWYQ